MKCFFSDISIVTNRLKSRHNDTTKRIRYYLVENFKTLNQICTLTFILANDTIEDLNIVSGLPHAIHLKASYIEELNEMETLIFLDHYRKKIEKILEHHKPYNQKDKLAKDSFLKFLQQCE